MNETLIDTVHYFLVIYTRCTRPVSGSGINMRMKTILNNYESLHLESSNPDDN